MKQLSLLTGLLCVGLVSLTVQAQDDDAQAQPWLGVHLKPVPQSVRAQVAIPGQSGLMVESVLAQGPAAAAGIQPFDILYGYDTQILFNNQQLAALIASAEIGDTTSLKLVRKGQPLEVSVTLTQRPENMPSRKPWFDVNIDFEELKTQLQENEDLQRLLSSASEETQQIIEQIKKEMPSEEEIDAAMQAFQESMERKGRVWSERYHQLLNNGRASELEPRSSVEVMRRSTVNSDRKEIRYNDRDGSIVLQARRDSLSAVLKTAGGKTIFSGPLNQTAIQSLPEIHQKRIQHLLKIHRLEALVE